MGIQQTLITSRSKSSSTNKMYGAAINHCCLKLPVHPLKLDEQEEEEEEQEEEHKESLQLRVQFRRGQVASTKVGQVLSEFGTGYQFGYVSIRVSKNGPIGSQKWNTRPLWIAGGYEKSIKRPTTQCSTCLIPVLEGFSCRMVEYLVRTLACCSGGWSLISCGPADARTC